LTDGRKKIPTFFLGFYAANPVSAQKIPTFSPTVPKKTATIRNASACTLFFMSIATPQPETARAYSVRDLAKRFGVKPHVVLRWIGNGSLKATDVRADVDGSKKPRWKILPENLAAFEQARASRPEPAPQRRRAAHATAEPLGRRW
jgi:hypothetical protein